MLLFRRIPARNAEGTVRYHRFVAPSEIMDLGNDQQPLHQDH